MNCKFCGIPTNSIDEDACRAIECKQNQEQYNNYMAVGNQEMAERFLDSVYQKDRRLVK